jgi:hypothetical protein
MPVFLLKQSKTGTKVMVVHNDDKIYQHFPFQWRCKMFPNWDFWYENTPSGNLD